MYCFSMKQETEIVWGLERLESRNFPSKLDEQPLDQTNKSKEGCRHDRWKELLQILRVFRHYRIQSLDPIRSALDPLVEILKRRYGSKGKPVEGAVDCATVDQLGSETSIITQFYLIQDQKCLGNVTKTSCKMIALIKKTYRWAKCSKIAQRCSNVPSWERITLSRHQ